MIKLTCVHQLTAVFSQKEFVVRNLLVLLTNTWPTYECVYTYTRINVHVRIAQFLLLIGL